MSISLGANGGSYDYPQENDPAGWGDDATNWASAVSAALSNIGLGGTVNAKALIDMTSTTAKGFLPPKLTTVQRNAIASPPAGLVIYNTNTNQLEVYTGSNWFSVASTIDGNLTVNGNSTLNGTLTVTGTTTLASVTGTGLTVNGSTTLNGALTVTGSTSLQSVTSTGSTVNGILSVTGNTTLVNVTGANITSTGTILAASGTSGTPGISFDGDTDTGIFRPGANQFGIATDGVERFRIESTGQQSSTIPDLSGSNTTLYPEFKCRAWVNYKGTATRSIRGSGNVSSVTFVGTGQYTVNFTTAMPDANYSVCGASDNTSSAYPIKFFISSISNSSFTVMANRDTSGNMLDSDIICVAVFR